METFSLSLLSFLSNLIFISAKVSKKKTTISPFAKNQNTKFEVYTHKSDFNIPTFLYIHSRQIWAFTYTFILSFYPQLHVNDFPISVYVSYGLLKEKHQWRTVQRNITVNFMNDSWGQQPTRNKMFLRAVKKVDVKALGSCDLSLTQNSIHPTLSRPLTLSSPSLCLCKQVGCHHQLLITLATHTGSRRHARARASPSQHPEIIRRSHWPARLSE